MNLKDCLVFTEENKSKPFQLWKFFSFLTGNIYFPPSFIPGWYVVWQLFLSKFKFLRELVGDAGTPQAETQPSEKSERLANASQRQRPRTARQRVAYPESSS